jgi:hypothetical protein
MKPAKLSAKVPSPTKKIELKAPIAGIKLVSARLASNHNETLLRS